MELSVAYTFALPLDCFSGAGTVTEALQQAYKAVRVLFTGLLKHG
jgi:hypothetical protein